MSAGEESSARRAAIAELCVTLVVGVLATIPVVSMIRCKDYKFTKGRFTLVLGSASLLGTLLWVGHAISYVHTPNPEFDFNTGYCVWFGAQEAIAWFLFAGLTCVIWYSLYSINTLQSLPRRLEMGLHFTCISTFIIILFYSYSYCSRLSPISTPAFLSHFVYSGFARDLFALLPLALYYRILRRVAQQRAVFYDEYMSADEYQTMSKPQKERYRTMMRVYYDILKNVWKPLRFYPLIIIPFLLADLLKVALVTQTKDEDYTTFKRFTNNRHMFHILWCIFYGAAVFVAFMAEPDNRKRFTASHVRSQFSRSSRRKRKGKVNFAKTLYTYREYDPDAPCGNPDNDASACSNGSETDMSYAMGAVAPQQPSGYIPPRPVNTFVRMDSSASASATAAPSPLSSQHTGSTPRARVGTGGHLLRRSAVATSGPAVDTAIDEALKAQDAAIAEPETHLSISSLGELNILQKKLRDKHVDSFRVREQRQSLLESDSEDDEDGKDGSGFDPETFNYDNLPGMEAPELDGELGVGDASANVSGVEVDFVEDHSLQTPTEMPPPLPSSSPPPVSHQTEATIEETSLSLPVAHDEA
eukprot:m.245170 g.245170  ORF g.245170 m.245170 type:complete len:586 (-) comp15360_c4_seq3:356-2113(-)